MPAILKLKEFCVCVCVCVLCECICVYVSTPEIINTTLVKCIIM